MLSMIIFRITRLRPAICVGTLAQRDQAVDEVGIHLAPDPAVHRAHRGPEDQAQMVDLQPISEQRVLRADHVVVGVVGEPRMEAVAWLARFAVADAVGQDDEIARRIEQLARPEQLPPNVRDRKPRPYRRCHAGSGPHSARRRRRHAGACRAFDNAVSVWAAFRRFRIENRGR